MLAILTMTMSLVYSEIEGLHKTLVMNGPLHLLEKLRIREITGFIYYKLSTVIKYLLADSSARSFRPQFRPPNTGQLTLGFVL